MRDVSPFSCTGKEASHIVGAIHCPASLHPSQAEPPIFLGVDRSCRLALAHPDRTEYFDIDQLNFVKHDTVTKRANNWVSKNYPSSSAEIVRMKNDINSQDAHTNIAAGGSTFGYDPNEKAIITSFFDFEDNEIVQADLLVCAQAGLVGFDLLLAVRNEFGGFIAERSVVEDWQRLCVANQLLLAEMLSKPRWAKLRAGAP